jgi:hypothetical protein
VITGARFQEALGKFKYRFRRSGVEYEFYNVKLPALRRMLNEPNLRVNDVEALLRRIGYIEVARAHDGAESTWIIAVNPREPRQLSFLKAWCLGLRDLEADPGLASFVDSIEDLAFMEVSDGLKFYMVYQGVRAVQDPCEVLKSVQQ